MKITGDTEKRGTEVHFLPDDEIFSRTSTSTTTCWPSGCASSRFLNNGVKIRLVDERNAKEDNFAFAGGVKGFVEFINQGKKVLHPNIFHAIGEKPSEQGPTSVSRWPCSGTTATTRACCASPTTSRSATAAPT
jgi:DNA gyrase subunit B